MAMKRKNPNVNTEQQILLLCIVQPGCEPAVVVGVVLVVIGLETSLTVLAEFDCEFRETELASLELATEMEERCCGVFS